MPIKKPVTFMTTKGKLKAHIKRKWIEALRSGRFLQGAGYLRMRADGERTEYCCLGVLAEITKYKHEYSDCFLPDELMPKDLIQERLAAMNDGQGDPETGNIYQVMSFRRIATWIQKNL